MDTAQNKNSFSNSLNKLFSHRGLWILIPLCIFIPMSLFNFISHSEFWGITSAQLFGEFSSEAIVIYYRSSFYALLKTLYFLPLENITHIKTARLLFALIASLNTFFIAKIIYQWCEDKKLSLVYILFLLSFHIYFYNIFRVRSDVLALFFFLWSIYKTNNLFLTGQSLFSWKTLSLIFLCFLATPKAILLVLVFTAYIFYLKSLRGPSSRFNIKLGLYLILPCAIVALSSLFLRALDTPESNPFVYALLYFLNTAEQLFTLKGWSNVLLSLQINFLHYFALLLGWIFILKKKNERFGWALPLLAFSSTLCFLVYSEKWDYFFASYTPLIFLPTLSILSWILSKKFRTLLLIPLLIIPLFMTRFTGWYFSNEKQMKTIKELEQIFDQIPNSKYFDSTGLLPRRPAILSFYGPGDEGSYPNTFKRVERLLPTFIFYTNKVSLGGPAILHLLQGYYVEIREDVWVLSIEIDQIEKWSDEESEESKVSLDHLFIYDRRPYIRKLW